MPTGPLERVGRTVSRRQKTLLVIVLLVPVLWLAFTRLVAPTANDHYSGCGLRPYAGLAAEGDRALVGVSAAGGHWDAPILPGTNWRPIGYTAPEWAPRNGTILGTATLVNGAMSVDFGDGHVVVFHRPSCS